MLRTLTWLVALWLITACGGDDTGPKGDYSEQCGNSSDCKSGLECITRLCTIRCTAHAACQALSGDGACTAGICYDTCESTFNCPNGLACTMSISGQTCQVR